MEEERHTGQGVLYVVATPIGNLEDFSERAAKTLRSVDLIACEDTRQTGKLLTRFAINTPTSSYREHNEEAMTPRLLDRLRKGETVALISDAGTPLLADPGYRLVHGCREAGIPVVPIPGPFAAAAALSVAGLPTDRFYFVGFPPRKMAELQTELERLGQISATLVFYLSPHRLKKTLGELASAWPDRQAFLIREMTKIHETHYQGTLSQIARRVSGERPRGEYALVVEGAKQPSLRKHLSVDVRTYVAGLMSAYDLTRKEASRRAANHLGLSANEVYRLSIEKGD